MSGKSAREVKVGWSAAAGAAIVALLTFGSAWLVLGRSKPQSFSPVAFAPSVPTPTVPAPTTPSQPDRAQPSLPASPEAPEGATQEKLAAIEQPLATATGQPTRQPRSPQTLQAVRTAVRQGQLRISNPTDYPVRVALLSQTTSQPQSNARKEGSGAPGLSPAYDIPAHWDFSPQEGSEKGLIVSLPDRMITVKKGDVLVAFAQDGSRRYWGPFVVGETETPLWNPKTKEWQLILQP